MNVEYNSNLKINKQLISFNFMMFYRQRLLPPYDCCVLWPYRGATMRDRAANMIWHYSAKSCSFSTATNRDCLAMVLAGRYAQQIKHHGHYFRWRLDRRPWSPPPTTRCKYRRVPWDRYEGM